MDQRAAAAGGAGVGGEDANEEQGQVPQDDHALMQDHHTSFCPYCSIHLQYPAGSKLIQCPSCNNTLDPNSAHQTRCTGCNCLLAYPPRSLYIQCPKCFHTMDPRLMVAPTPQHLAASSASSTPAEPKKRRDPNAPKAVCNAYMIFCKSRRGELKNELPELAFGKIGAKLGEMWRNMTQEEKKPYEDRAMVDRERYRREMVEYTAGRGDGHSSSKRARHDDAHSTEEDQKLARDVSQQQQKAAARARREQQQQRQRQQEEEEEESGEERAAYSDEQEEEQ